VDDVAQTGGRRVTTAIPAAVVTVAVALALLVTGAGAAPPAAPVPRAGHAPTHYENAFTGLSPARDVWGQYERTR
jgi:hypothetical protein